jgi:hypothetical protein
VKCCAVTYTEAFGKFFLCTYLLCQLYRLLADVTRDHENTYDRRKRKRFKQYLLFKRCERNNDNFIRETDTVLWIL